MNPLAENAHFQTLASEKRLRPLLRPNEASVAGRIVRINDILPAGTVVGFYSTLTGAAVAAVYDKAKQGRPDALTLLDANLLFSGDNL